MTRFWQHLRKLWPGWTILRRPSVLRPRRLGARRTVRSTGRTRACFSSPLATFCLGPRTKRLFLGLYPLGHRRVRLRRDAARPGRRRHARSGASLRSARARARALRRDHERSASHAPRLVPGAPVAGARRPLRHTVCERSSSCAWAARVWLYVRDYPRMLRFTWCFFALNVAGFVTYHLYPAAPPWYFHAHGCAVDVLAHASEGPALARVDARLGIHYFAGMYGRASRRLRRHAQPALRLRVHRDARGLGRVQPCLAGCEHRLLRADVLLGGVPRPSLGARCGRGRSPTASSSSVRRACVTRLVAARARPAGARAERARRARSHEASP